MPGPHIVKAGGSTRKAKAALSMSLTRMLKDSEPGKPNQAKIPGAAARPHTAIISVRSHALPKGGNLTAHPPWSRCWACPREGAGPMYLLP